MYLRRVPAEHVWEHAGIEWRLGLSSSGPTAAAVWSLATIVRDESMSNKESKFYKSIDSECDDPGKKGSLLNMLNQLRWAIRQEDYQNFLKDSNVQVKDAGKFNYRGKSHKIWELKYQKKDRIYFFTYRIIGQTEEKILVLLLFHHKKDQTTPRYIIDYCEKVMKDFLDPSPNVKILKEVP